MACVFLIWPGDRLIVHLGHPAYRGALVIASCLVEPEPNVGAPAAGLSAGSQPAVSLNRRMRGFGMIAGPSDERVSEMTSTLLG